MLWNSGKKRNKLPKSVAGYVNPNQTGRCRGDIFAASAFFHFYFIFLFFFCMSSVGKMNIFLTIVVVLESRSLEKTFIDFSNNTFPIETGIIDLFYYISGT